MAGFVGILVSDPWLQNQFTQVELRSLKSKFMAMRGPGGNGSSIMVRDLAAEMSRMKIAGDGLADEEKDSFLRHLFPNLDVHVDFEAFLRAYLKMEGHIGRKNSSSEFLKAATTTLLHTISESEKASYVGHINSYLGGDDFLKRHIPIDPLTEDLFEISKDGVLLCKLINVAVPGTIDERAINTKAMLNPWERNENHTLCLNSAKAIGCTVVNIGTQDLVEGRPHLVLGLISQIIKIQLLADVNLKKTPQLAELVGDSREMEELMSLPPEKILLRWMNFQLKKGGFNRAITNFSSDVKDSEAYACLLNVLAPEHSIKLSGKNVKDPLERAKLVLEHADRMGCKRYLTPKDIVDGSPNLNLAFVAHIFQKRWILLEAIDKSSPGIVSWKFATKPPIRMPFRKVENCNQVVKIGKQLKFSLVNIAGNDIVQGNKKLILAFLWQLMRYNILQLLKNLKSNSCEKEITDADILNWANNKVKYSGRQSRMESFKDKSLSSGIFFLELLSAVDPRVVNWSLVTKGENEEEKKMNATYIISVARKLGCSIFLLPEDILEVNQKMMLTLAASIMYWHSKKPSEDKFLASDIETGSSTEIFSNTTVDDSASESSTDDGS
ncbi:hypothetical protein KFK09_000243 [Dendrobium nobile]|uniref:Calponin-homology (CH) domain-containing protein n=1 Tax=Dendrobium nobile TaxID=94219 RepID=A0A8T3CAJ3_DENNO|nr:hypothetical protein KFK09_000243 [Dendrobium nobile]